MGPFDDQAVIDLLESGTYADRDGSSASWSNVGVQETGATTVMAGYLSLVAREARITKSITATPTRPEEGGRYTAGDGLVWQIAAVKKLALANCWELTARTFNVPGGLTETVRTERRSNDDTTPAALTDPGWSELGEVAGKLIPDAQDVDAGGETAVDTMIRGKLIVEGYREIRAGDRASNDDGDTWWTVDGSEPVDLSSGLQVLTVSRRV